MIFKSGSGSRGIAVTRALAADRSDVYVMAEVGDKGSDQQWIGYACTHRIADGIHRIIRDRQMVDWKSALAERNPPEQVL